MHRKGHLCELWLSQKTVKMPPLYEPAAQQGVISITSEVHTCAYCRPVHNIRDMETNYIGKPMCG